MDEGYSEEDAILQAKLALLDAHKHAKNTMDLVLITREWMALAECIRQGKSDPPTWKEG